MKSLDLEFLGTEWLISLSLGKGFVALVAGALSSIIAFPSFRLGVRHLAVLNSVGRYEIKTIYNMNFLLPVLAVIMWIRPLSRDFFTSWHSPGGRLITEDQFEAGRMYLMLLICFFRLLALRSYAQTHLDVGLVYAEQLLYSKKAEAQKQAQTGIYIVYLSLCTTVVEIIAPILALLGLTLILLFRGDWTFGMCQYFGYNEVAFLNLLPPSFVRHIFSFYCWWFLLFGEICFGLGLYSNAWN